MGYRIHVCTTYNVEHSIYGRYSHCNESLNSILAENCPTISYDGEYPQYAEHLEVSRIDLANFIGKLANERPKYEEWCKENLGGETLDGFIQEIARWIADSDQSNEYVVLDWF